MLMSLNVQGSTQRKGFLFIVVMFLSMFASQVEAARSWTSTPLTLKSQPVDTTVNEGSAVNFSISATSSRTISYTWFKDGVKVGRNRKNYSISSATPAHAGTYSCRITDGRTTIDCTPFQLQVNSATVPTSDLTLVSQPASTSINEGDSTTFAMNVTSSKPVTYTWFKDGSAIGGGSALAISNATSGHAGTYSCQATDAITTVNCAPFTLQVIATPVSDLTLNSQPVNTTLYEGNSTTFTMNVSSSRPVTYTWLKNGSVIGSGSTLTVSNATLSSAGSYSCRATDTIATLNCSSFTLTINQIVRITQQPTSQMLNEGGSASLNVSATGTAPISYQWYRNGSAISGATSNTLSFASAIMDNAGDYYCRVSNPGSTANSASATLSIVAVARTGSALISWQAPTSRADGSPLTADQIAGYELFHSADSANGLTRLTSLGNSELSIVVEDLAAGTHYFALATKDVSGLQSAMSSTITVTIR